MHPSKKRKKSGQLEFSCEKEIKSSNENLEVRCGIVTKVLVKNYIFKN